MGGGTTLGDQSSLMFRALMLLELTVFLIGHTVMFFIGEYLVTNQNHELWFALSESFAFWCLNCLDKLGQLI